MTNQLGDAPARRAADDKHAQRTMLELRWRYGAFDEDTQEIVIDPPAPKVSVNTSWCIRLAQIARRVLGRK